MSPAVNSPRTGSARAAYTAALVLLLFLGASLAAAAAGEAKTRLRVTAKPPSVVPGQAVKVRITGTRARRCALSVRTDRYRAKPFLRRRVARRSRIKIARRVAPGAKVLVVRCGKRKAYTSLVVDDGIPDGIPDGEWMPGDDEQDLLDGWPEDDYMFEDEEPFTEIDEPAVVPNAKDTKAPTKPSGLTKSASSTTSITLSWKASTDNVKVTGYSAFRSGKRVANVTAKSYKFTGLACGKSYPLGVLAYDAAGNKSATASLTASTAACPPARKVSLTKGASAQGLAGCVTSHCRYMVVNFKNFPSGNHTITCRASNGSEGGFYTYKRSGTSNTSAVCYYGFQGRTAWVTVDGTSSNKIAW